MSAIVFIRYHTRVVYIMNDEMKYRAFGYANIGY